MKEISGHLLTIIAGGNDTTGGSTTPPTNPDPRQGCEVIREGTSAIDTAVPGVVGTYVGAVGAAGANLCEQGATLISGRAAQIDAAVDSAVNGGGSSVGGGTPDGSGSNWNFNYGVTDWGSYLQVQGPTG